MNTMEFPSESTKQKLEESSKKAFEKFIQDTGIPYSEEHGSPYLLASLAFFSGFRDGAVEMVDVMATDGLPFFEQIFGKDETSAKVPVEPTPGILMSMAMSFDHALGCPGYYDQPIFADDGLTHETRLRQTLDTMKKLYNEVVGEGFYSPGKEEMYAKLTPKS